MHSLLNWIIGREKTTVEEEVFFTFGIFVFILANILLTIYSREFSEDTGRRANQSREDLWLERRYKASGLRLFEGRVY